MGKFDLRLLPGTTELLRAQQAELPQHDALCGPFWGLVALRALAGLAHDDADQEAVAVRARTSLPPGSGAATRPPGEAASPQARVTLPSADDEASAGTSPAGLTRAIEELSGERLVVTPLSGPWTSDSVTALLAALAVQRYRVGVLANIATSALASSHLSLVSLLDYLETARLPDGRSDWDVGHFIALVGLLEGAHGRLIVVADSYPSIGHDGVHLQPIDSVVSALRRDGSGGGLLVVAAQEAHASVRLWATGAGLDIGLWDNGSVIARLPGYEGAP